MLACNLRADMRRLNHYESAASGSVGARGVRVLRRLSVPPRRRRLQTFTAAEKLPRPENAAMDASGCLRISMDGSPRRIRSAS